MVSEQEWLEHKARIRMLELKIESIIEILSKEGTILKEEIEQEVKNLVKDGP